VACATTTRYTLETYIGTACRLPTALLQIRSTDAELAAALGDVDIPDGHRKVITEVRVRAKPRADFLGAHPNRKSPSLNFKPLCSSFLNLRSACART